MCNAYRLRAPANQIALKARKLGLPFLFEETGLIPNLEPRDMTRPTNVLPVARPVDPAAPTQGLELVDMRWWMVPFFHKGPDVKAWKAMCTNARAAEIKAKPTYRDAYRRRRGLVFADGFIEWSPKGSSTRYLIERVDGDLMVFPAVWDRWTPAEGDTVESFSILTCDPGEGMNGLHDRQPVILEDHEAGSWLDLSTDPAESFLGSRAGALTFTRLDA